LDLADAFFHCRISFVFQTYRTDGRNTFDIGARGEEAAFACKDGEDGFGVVVEDAEGVDGVADEVAAEGVEGFGAVELWMWLVYVVMGYGEFEVWV
jgi:hypothetical protein